MILIELNDAILYGEKKTVEVPIVTSCDIDKFQYLLLIGRNTKQTYESVDNAMSFFQFYPDIKKVLGAKKATECFYGLKLGYTINGVSSKLVYSVSKMLKECGAANINKAISSANSLLAPYASSEFVVDGEKYTVKDVIENLVHRPVKLLSSSMRKVETENGWEVYVPDVDRVLILPDDIGKMISLEDCEKIHFDRSKGVMLGDVLLRTMNNRMGVTLDEFDLTRSV